MKKLLIVFGIIILIMGLVIAYLIIENPKNAQDNVVLESEEETIVEEKQGWYEVGVFAGTDNEKTQSFIINEGITKWKISYTIKGADYLPAFSIAIYDNNTNEIVKLGTTSNGLSAYFISDGTYEVLIEDLKEGEYYLDVISTNLDLWEIKVEELY